MLAKKALWPSNFKRARVDNYSLRDWRALFSSEEPTLTCVLGLRHKLDNALECLVGILDEIKPGDTINHKTGNLISKQLQIMVYLTRLAKVFCC